MCHISNSCFVSNVFRSLLFLMCSVIVACVSNVFRYVSNVFRSLMVLIRSVIFACAYNVFRSVSDVFCV